MTPKVELHLGDCLEVMRGLPDSSVDAVVSDPPAGISFMSAKWDHDKGGRRQWIDWLSSVLAECLRIAKPGAVLLCWAIPRTSHWTGTAIEDAGWIIENRIAHVFGSGFPKHKSHLKPAVEDWWLARKPGPKWLGVESNRVAAPDGLTKGGNPNGSSPLPMNRVAGRLESRPRTEEHPSGRWPANLLLSHSAMCGEAGCDECCPIRLMGEQGQRAGVHGAGNARSGKFGGEYSASSYDLSGPREMGRFGDSGSPARFFPNFDAEPCDPFFYTPKAPARERWFYCRDCDDVFPSAQRKDHGHDHAGTDHIVAHPTQKSVALMRWLCRLVCHPGGTILDPFMGSGSTGRGAVLEGFSFIGIEREPEYHAIAQRRIAEALESESKPVPSRPQNKGK